jgi:arsenate reductase
MAEGILRHIAGERFEIFSAGLEPSLVRPEAIETMREIGIDISSHRSKSVGEFAGEEFDYIVTVCDNATENCPIFSGNAARTHWNIDDPAAVKSDHGQRLNAFRHARDELMNKLLGFKG